jgi:hypothetical protein
LAKINQRSKRTKRLEKALKNLTKPIHFFKVIKKNYKLFITGVYHMWNEESSLAVNHWRDFLIEEKPPELEKAVDIENPIEPIVPIEPIKPAAPPAPSPPQKPTPDELHANPELAKRKYSICKTKPELCATRRPASLSELPIPIYDTPVSINLDDLPSELNISNMSLIKGMRDGKEYMFDEFTNEPATKNFFDLINRSNGWVRFENSPGVKYVVPGNAWGTVQTKIFLTSLGKLPGAIEKPFIVRDLTQLVDTGDYVSVGHPFGHLSHLDGTDADLSIPNKTTASGQSVDENEKRFLPHRHKLLGRQHFDVDRTLAVLRHYMPHSELIFLWAGYYPQLQARAAGLIRDNKMTQEEYNLIFTSGNLQPGCKKGRRHCRDHDNHFHIRFKGPSLPKYSANYAPWYHKAGVTPLSKSLRKQRQELMPGGKKSKVMDRINQLRKASGKPFTPEEIEVLQRVLREYKFKKLVSLLKEWKNKKYLIEQPMDPAMMDPATQRLQMAKQAIQMQYGPLFTQAADIMFTLNSLEDPAAKQQARIYADRIQAELRDFFSGKEDPMESMMDLGPIVDEMGRKLERFMS